MSLTPASDDDLVSRLAKTAAESRHLSAAQQAAAALGRLSCVDGLSLLVAAVTARSILHESPGLENLADLR